MFEEYPKKITLPDGLSVTLRPMTPDDQYALYSFFVNLGSEDRRFLHNVVTDRKLIEKWARNLDYDNVLPILAEYEGRIVANATLHYQTFGWGRHVAEIRVIVAPEFQGRRLGPALIEELTALASRNKVKKLLARIVTTRQSAISVFERAGFNQVTELKNYVKDLQNQEYADTALLVKELQIAAWIKLMRETLTASAVRTAIDMNTLPVIPAVEMGETKNLLELIIETYPRSISLKNVTQITLRPLLKEDEKVLMEYFRGLPLKDRYCLKEDVADRQVIENWINDLDYDKIFPLIALNDGKIVGDATLNFNPIGCLKNQAEVRLTTDSRYRLKGLGTILLQNLIDIATHLGLEQLSAEIPPILDKALYLFQKIGFKKVAELRGFVRDMKGQESDLILLTKFLNLKTAEAAAEFLPETPRTTQTGAMVTCPGVAQISFKL